MQTRLDKFGRVIIPKSVRQKLGLKPGEILELEEEGEKIVIKPSHKKGSLVLKDGVLVFTGKAEAELLEAVKEDRNKRIDHLSRL